MKDEMLACFDAAGNSIHPHLRSKALKEPFPDYYHAVANIWVVDREGRILCSQRSKLVPANKLKWQSKFGGHVLAGNTFLENAIKELKEEAGLTATEADLILVSKNVNQSHKHFSENFMLLFDHVIHEVRFIDGETAAIKWMSFEEYMQDRQSNPGKWVNNLEPEAYKKIQKILKKGSLPSRHPSTSLWGQAAR